MSNIWTATVEHLVGVLENDPEAVINDADENPFDDANEIPTPSVDNGPPIHFQHEDSDSPDISPVDYDDGTGEWRELDELRGYTVEEIQRIMQDVYEEYMDRGDGYDESESNSGAAAVDDYLASLPSEVDTGGNYPQKPQSESPADEAQSDQTRSLSEFIPVDTHTEPSGRDQAGFVNGWDDVSVPENGGSTGQATVGDSAGEEHEHHHTGSIPELVVTDYDSNESIALGQFYPSTSTNSHHLTDIDSLPGLERMSGTRNQPLDFDYDEHKEHAEQGLAGVLGDVLPVWTREIEFMPGYETFTGSPGPDDTDFDDDRVGLLSSEHGRLGNQGDEEDIPWDARPTSFFNFETHSGDERPSVPLSPLPDVFHGLARSSDDVETINFSELPNTYANENEIEEVRPMLERLSPAEEVLSEYEWFDFDLAFTDMATLYDAQMYAF